MISICGLLSLCAVGASGCGGGSGAATSSTRETANARLTSGDSHGQVSEGGSQFRVTGGNKQEVNRIIAGSKEASLEEMEAASSVLETSLEARAAHNWVVQCRTLSAKIERLLGKPGAVLDQSCVESLGAAGEKASNDALADTMEDGIGALRLIGGGQAFAFYHGTQDKNYLIPMEREGGEWKVASLAPEAIPES
jgi:hypothetical protein